MRLLLVTTIALITFATHAQSKWQLVYYRGTVEKSSNGKWFPLTVVGTQLNTGEYIKLSDKSEAILTNDKKQMVQLKQVGKFAVKDFDKYVMNESNQGFATYYLKYVAGEITHKKEKVEDNYRANLRNLGGVSRGNYANCLVAPVNATLVKNTNVTFSWKKSGPANYTLTIYEDSTLATEVYSATVKDTFAQVNLNEAGLKADKTYWWTVGGRGIAACNIYAFKNLGFETVAPLENEFQKLKEGLNFSPGMNKAIEGKFWEDKGLMDEAYEAYTAACGLEPGNETFARLKKAFEEKIGR